MKTIEEYKIQSANKTAAKVAAQNLLGKAINEYHNTIRAFLFKWIGQKVSLATGGRPHKLKAELETLNLPHYPRLRICLDFGNYNIHSTVMVDAVVNGEYQTAEGCDYFANVMDGVLKDMNYNFNPWRTDYTVEEIQCKRNEFKIAQKAFEDARSALYPFGEHDNG